METLIFNGSPRKNGDTASLIGELRRSLRGDVTVIDAYTFGAAPCTDCRYCREHPGCAVKDGWQEIDGLLRRCDAVVIATPIYFSQPTGPLLSLLSRTQQYFCARFFRQETVFSRPRRGGVILAGGGTGSPERAAETAESLLWLMGVRETASFLCCHHTDELPALEEPGVRDRLKALARFLEQEDLSA